jgi:SsrA-binding protein
MTTFFSSSIGFDMLHIIHKKGSFARKIREPTSGIFARGRFSGFSISMLLCVLMTTYVSHKRATFDFELLEKFEAGISLLGTEVKSIRNKHGKLDGAYVVIRGGEALLVGASIPAFQKKNIRTSYDPERPRTLLLTKKELAELEHKSEKQGLTIVPIRLYNKGSKLKLEIAVARGKKKHDKRESIKARDVQRDLARELKY